MESLKTQTVKHTYLVTFIVSDPVICFRRCAAEVCAESVSAALRALASELKANDTGGTYSASVRLVSAPNVTLYANAMVAPDDYTFLRKCAEDAALTADQEIGLH